MYKTLTLTIIANMTSNYSEGLGNIASVQKVFKKGKVYSMRSRESLKNALMAQSGMYDDLVTSVDGATQKAVSEEMNASNTRALEGGYMNTKGNTYVRNSSIYLTDAIACDEFVNETRFHNNLYLATNYANSHGLNLQDNAKEVGLMPYQYEYDKSMKIYSITIDLEMIGKDNNFLKQEASNSEKATRVNMLLNAIQKLSLVVKGNLDNAEPLFIVGGLSEYKTHYFENVVHVKNNKLLISDDLNNKLNQGFSIGLLKGENFDNEEEVIANLNPVSINEFFSQLNEDVELYFNK